MQRIIIFIAALCLGACASGSIGSSTGTARSAGASAPAVRPAPVLVPSQSVREAGLQNIIGANGTALLERFGKARIDLTEGTARKLQFANEACVIDIFLYPLQSGRDPVATHIEARNRKTGAAEDKAACARVLTKQIMR
ncbi:MAG: hypothetical protein AAGL10_06110 [Pseudomonadota bacterium]